MAVKDLANLSDDELRNRIDTSMEQVSVLMGQPLSNSFSKKHNEVYVAAVAGRVSRAEGVFDEIKQYIGRLKENKE